MDRQKTGYFQAKLTEKREQIEKQIKTMEEEGLHQSLQDSVGELSSYDNHPGDLGNETFERGKEIALRDNAVIQLQQIDEALGRIENGSFGFCVSCKKPISEERLEVVPETEYCVDCRKKAEKEKSQVTLSPEANLVRHPFQEHSVGKDPFSSEEAWQAVASYGTSETPSDQAKKTEYRDWDEEQEIADEVDGIPYLKDENGMIAKDYTKRAGLIAD